MNCTARRRFFAATVTLAALLSSPFCVNVARAQQEQPEQAVPAKPAFTPPSTLAAGLKGAQWRAAQRGPLFAVDPLGTRLWRPKRDYKLPPEAEQPKAPPIGPPDGPDGTYHIETLAPFFGRKLTRVGSVTVLAPTEMTVIASDVQGNADPVKGLSRDEKIQVLQASLTDAQWKQMGSPTGLGIGDLDATQRALFLAVLPDPFILTSYTVKKDAQGRTIYENGTNNKTTLSEGERQQIRLRLNRTTRLTIPSQNDKNGCGEYVNTASEPQTPFYQVGQPNDYNKPEAFGVVLKDTVPAKLKQGQIDFESSALDATIDLRGVKTVGALMEKIAKATNLEIFADARVAKRALWVFGDPLPAASAPPVKKPETSANGAPTAPANANTAAAAAEPTPAAEPAPARAGDALKALCWAVTGAIRKVGPVYLLTDDIEGIGTRQAKIGRWVDEGNTRKSQLISRYTKTIRDHEPMQHIGFAAGDASAIKPDLMTKVEAEWKTSRGRYQGTKQNTSDLSPEQQKMVQNAIVSHQERANRGEKNLQPIVLDKVNVSVMPKLTYVMPGDKEADANVYLSLNNLLPPPATTSWDGKPLPSTDPVVLPPILARGGVVVVSPQSLSEIGLTIDAAKEKGLRGVWVVLDGLDGQQKISPEVLAQAAQMGKERGVPVSAVVRLLLAPSPKVEDAAVPSVDRNITVASQTGAQIAAVQARLPEYYPGANMYRTIFSPQADWLRPEAPLTAPLLKRRLLEIAQTPNLAGIVITNATAPGYGEKPGSPYYDAPGNDYGYTMENRLACLKETHVDPIDFGGEVGYGEVDLAIPFFVNGQTRQWTDDGELIKNKNAPVDPRDVWKTQRVAQTTALMTDLYKAFRAAQPTLPLFLSDFQEGFRSSAVIAWDKPDALPLAMPYDYSSEENNIAPLVQARKLSQTVLLTVQCGYCVVPTNPNYAMTTIAPGTGQAFARLVNGTLDPIKEVKSAAPGARPTWDGVVLNFGEVPVSQAVELLKTGMATPSTASGSSKSVAKK